MRIEVGPTGKLVTGSVLDCNKKSLEEALKRYDDLLYITWNPKKQGGMGCWEVRRKPSLKTAVHQGEFQGVMYSKLELKEIDHVHHVLDVPVLGYHVPLRLMQMDSFRDERCLKDMQYRQNKYAEMIESKAREERKYAIKQHKKLFSDFKELVRSGMNPNLIARHWK